MENKTFRLFGLILAVILGYRCTTQFPQSISTARLDSASLGVLPNGHLYNISSNYINLTLELFHIAIVNDEAALVSALKRHQCDTLRIHNAITAPITVEQKIKLTQLLAQIIRAIPYKSLEFVGFNYPTSFANEQTSTPTQSNPSKPIAANFNTNTIYPEVILLLARCNASFAMDIAPILHGVAIVKGIGCLQCNTFSLDWIHRLRVPSTHPLFITIIQDSSRKIILTQAPQDSLTSRIEIHLNLCQTNSQLEPKCNTDLVHLRNLTLQISLQGQQNLLSLQHSVELGNLEIFGLTKSIVKSYCSIPATMHDYKLYLSHLNICIDSNFDLDPKEHDLFRKFLGQIGIVLTTPTANDDLPNTNPAQHVAASSSTSPQWWRNKNQVDESLQFSKLPDINVNSTLLPPITINIEDITSNLSAREELFMSINMPPQPIYAEATIQVKDQTEQEFDRNRIDCRLLTYLISDLVQTTSRAIKAINTPKAYHSTATTTSIPIIAPYSTRIQTLTLDGFAFSYLTGLLNSLEINTLGLIIRIINTRIPSLESCLALLDAPNCQLITLQVSAADIQSFDATAKFDFPHTILARLFLLVDIDIISALTLITHDKLTIPICFSHDFYYNPNYHSQICNLPKQTDLFLYNTTFDQIMQINTNSAQLLPQNLSGVNCHIYFAAEVELITASNANQMFKYLQTHYQTANTLTLYFAQPIVNEATITTLTTFLHTTPFQQADQGLYLIHNTNLIPSTIYLTPSESESTRSTDSYGRTSGP
ncbi:hypothetical protein NEHOM01_0166 [Nematocida homosporus]|uniref:uncharacterized protein n=1 Tax=Nematocida homosporus TaxID=1912981 RepID=UPI0022205F19|nr:uncharacterized protein NEHOM01_0166 [Nematocida homosporus]KAI5184421.1 hypothetical protein NEHOM01_0166 [Nematocida homosporus]